MDQNEKYQYNFEYSLANYCQVQPEQTQNDDESHSGDEELILRRSNELISFHCFVNKETQQHIRTIFTHFIQSYGRVAVRLFRICQKVYQNLQMTSSCFIRNHQDAIQHQRQKLVQNLAQLSKVFYDEKQKYKRLISLCVSGAVFKILTLEKQIHELQFETVFHSVYWQINGIHSTSQVLKKLLTDNFDASNFHNYLINEEPTKIYKVKSICQSLVRNSDHNLGIGPIKSLNSSIKSFKMQDPYIEEANKDELAFSKKIKRKEKPNKQNSSNFINKSYLKESLTEQPQMGKEQKYRMMSRKNHQMPRKQQVSRDKQMLRGQQLLINHQMVSNQKNFNFKKAPMTYFQNYSKSKSSKKLISDLNSTGKKPSFASYLQQKRLNF